MLTETVTARLMGKQAMAVAGGCVSWTPSPDLTSDLVSGAVRRRYRQRQQARRGPSSENFPNLAAAVEIDEEEIALDEGAAGLFDDA